jgi:hypothetical protein
MSRITAFVIAAALFSAAPAAAQPAPWQPERLSEGWVFTPSMVVGALWDSNVTIRNQGDPFLQEWVGLVNPRAEMNFNGRHTRFNIGYSGALEAYREFSELNRYEQRGRLSWRRQLSSRINADTHASYTRTPTTDRLELGPLPFLDIGSTIADAGGGLSADLTSRTKLSGEYRFSKVIFDQSAQGEGPSPGDGAEFLNGGYSHTPTVRLTHDVSPRITLGGEWQYQHALLEGLDNTFDIQNAVGEMSVRVTQWTTIRGGVGASNLSVAQTGVSVWGPAFRAAIEQRVERLKINARYNRAFVPSFSFGGVTGNQDFSLSVVAPITAGGRLTLSGSTTYSRTEPVEALGLGFQLDSMWLNGAIGYQVASWLRTEAFVASMHQTSTARGDIDRTRIGIQFITAKPVRIE